jgi:2'-5' RNA ligase
MAEMSDFIVGELTELFLSFRIFPFTLKKIGRFPEIGVLYLSVEPIEPFQQLSHAVQERFPELKSFIQDPILHVTVARVKDMDGTEKEFYLAYGNQLPIQATAKENRLYEKSDNVWHKRNIFHLSSQ